MNLHDTPHTPAYEHNGQPVSRATGPVRRAGLRGATSVMLSAGLPVTLIGSPINFADCLIGSPVIWCYSGLWHRP